MQQPRYITVIDLFWLAVIFGAGVLCGALFASVIGPVGWFIGTPLGSIATFVGLHLFARWLFRDTHS